MVLNNFLNSPILHHDGILADWIKVAVGYGLGLSTIAAIALSWDSINQRSLRIFLPITGLISVGYSVAKTRQIQTMEPFIQQRRVARQDAGAMVTARQMQPYFGNHGSQTQLMPANDGDGQLPKLDPIALKKQNTGLLVCGSSGSAKTTMIRFCLPYWVNEGYQIIVLDPHADQDNPEYPWGDFPYVVGDHDAIFRQIKILLDLLQSKDKQKIIVIADEWTDLLGYAQLESKELGKLLKNFLIRWGTGGRKFNKFLIGIGHTDNVEMWGLKGVGGLIRNFGILRLGDIAVRHAENVGKESDLFAYCSQTAYPLLVGDRPTIHPTHGHYQTKENGQRPINLQPLQFQELSFEFVGDRFPLNPPHFPSKHEPHATPSHTPSDWLERCYSLEPTRTHHTADEGDICPKCDSTNATPHGKTRAGSPRKRCNDCGKTWTV